MKRFYISPVCEVFLTDQEEDLLLGSAEIISGDPGGYIPVDPYIPIGEGGDIGGSDDIGAKGGLVWDNTMFD